MKIREVQTQKFDNFELYNQFHIENYKENKGLKETGLWCNDNEEYFVNYIELY